ncbi:MAG: competence/damage-inducible protein A [Chloroflexi bacterium]|nr:competence/damage-inducible protein A [Chloroflexota bacterium]MDA1001892.1 competence/damage-inducible protein A [Chloroflexota bacterium]
MRAEIISIGTEILLGEIVDTNAAHIASALPEFGIDLMYVTQVGDNPARFEEVVARAWGRSDYIFMTGGLGPTEDDLTRETVGKTLGEELYLDEEQERIVRSFFAGRGAANMPERNLKQAMLIPSARAIPNPRGTAPGWWVERDGKVIAVMPGPPSEMTRMWEHEVAPELERRADSILVSRTLKTTGIGEGTVDEMLSPLLKGTNPSIGIYARADGVHARIAAKAPTREEAWHLIHPVEEEARAILGPSIWGVDDQSMASAVGQMLEAQGLTIALMESATGGSVANAFTDYEGASNYFKGSLVTYTAEAKISEGVPAELIAMHGMISRETSEAMAKAVRERLGSDLAIGITGIAGGEEVEGQPPGTMHIVLWDGQEAEYSHSRYYQGREAAKRRAVLQAMTVLRRYLMARAQGAVH